MSKYDEISESCKSTINQIRNYQDDCNNFAEKLISGLTDYYEIPDGKLKILPYEGEPEENYRYYIEHEMHLEDDTFYHFNFVIEFVGRSRFHFMLKKEDDCFIVKGHEGHSGHKINPDVEKDFTDFYDFLFDEIKEHHENGFTNWLKGEKSKFGRIGFQ